MSIVLFDYEARVEVSAIQWSCSRKLVVLLHHLWVSEEVYEPLHKSSRTTLAAAA